MSNCGSDLRSCDGPDWESGHETSLAMPGENDCRSESVPRQSVVRLATPRKSDTDAATSASEQGARETAAIYGQSSRGRVKRGSPAHAGMPVAFLHQPGDTDMRNCTMLRIASTTLTGFGLLLAPVPARSEEPIPAPALEAAAQAGMGLQVEPGTEVLARGPVHEAFAEPIVFGSVANQTVAQVPPAPIEELPPEQRPAGENITWIPGYWAWDSERSDFVWVSGLWRAIPPGREWVPGYWAAVSGGWQWVAGYWSDVSLAAPQYLPEPPESIDAGPSIAAPAADYSWAPGSWVWNDQHYAWRAGYWQQARPDCMWVPAHYSWCPRGYVFVDGYWDYDVDQRGMLFAPVYFDTPVYSQPNYCYSPSVVVDLGVFSNHLFVRPGCRQYYFGDYYAPGYRSAGIYPWFEFHTSRRGYDPIYAWQRQRHFRDRNWDAGIRTAYQQRRDNPQFRPDRTFASNSAGLNFRGNRHDFDGRDRQPLVTPLSRIGHASPGRGVQNVPEQRRREFVSQAREVRQFAGQRAQIEGVPRDRGDRGNQFAGGQRMGSTVARGRSPIRDQNRPLPAGPAPVAQGARPVLNGPATIRAPMPRDQAAGAPRIGGAGSAAAQDRPTVRISPPNPQVAAPVPDRRVSDALKNVPARVPVHESPGQRPARPEPVQARPDPSPQRALPAPPQNQARREPPPRPNSERPLARPAAPQSPVRAEPPHVVRPEPPVARQPVRSAPPQVQVAQPQPRVQARPEPRTVRGQSPAAPQVRQSPPRPAAQARPEPPRAQPQPRPAPVQARQEPPRARPAPPRPQARPEPPRPQPQPRAQPQKKPDPPKQTNNSGGSHPTDKKKRGK